MTEEMQQDGDCQRCGGKGCIACDARVLPECQHCEYHKNRAARWRAEAYKQAGHDVIELPWVGLTDEDKQIAFDDTQEASGGFWEFADAIEAKLKEKNT